MKSAAEQQATMLASKVKAFESERETFCRNFEGLLKSHTDTLGTVKRLRPDIKNLVPVLNQLEVGPKETDSRRPRHVMQRSEVSDLPVMSKPIAQVDEKQVAVPGSRGEIIARPIFSFIRATRFVQELLRMDKVKQASIRNYSGGVLTVDVNTGGISIASLDLKEIKGFPIETVEVTGTQIRIKMAVVQPNR